MPVAAVLLRSCSVHPGIASPLCLPSSCRLALSMAASSRRFDRENPDTCVSMVVVNTSRSLIRGSERRTSIACRESYEHGDGACYQPRQAIRAAHRGSQNAAQRVLAFASQLDHAPGQVLCFHAAVEATRAGAAFVHG